MSEKTLSEEPRTKNFDRLLSLWMRLSMATAVLAAAGSAIRPDRPAGRCR